MNMKPDYENFELLQMRIGIGKLKSSLCEYFPPSFLSVSYINVRETINKITETLIDMEKKLNIL